MTNHDHDYYHDDCGLCQMEKEAQKTCQNCGYWLRYNSRSSVPELQGRCEKFNTDDGTHRHLVEAYGTHDDGCVNFSEDFGCILFSRKER